MCAFYHNLKEKKEVERQANEFYEPDFWDKEEKSSSPGKEKKPKKYSPEPQKDVWKEEDPFATQEDSKQEETDFEPLKEASDSEESNSSSCHKR